MANSILKLNVETSEYDAKLKKAAEGIRHLVEVAHKGDGDMTGLEKSTLDYIKAVGEMETKSRTAAGQVRELESTFKELTVVYNNLNDVEKADEGGKALAASLEQIKQRAQEAKAQLDTATQSLNDHGQSGKESSGILEGLASKFTINIDAIKLFNMGLTAAKAALDVAKDAFFNNEEQLDEWGRIVQSGESVYKGFLNSLNTGDISGFLSNIGNIVQAARDAYNALDELGTYNAFNQINVEKTRTNMTESIADFRSGQGSKEAVKASGDAYKKELKDRQRLENEAYLEAVKKMAAERGVKAKDLQDALSGTYGHYQDLKNVQMTGVRETVVGAGMFARKGTEKFAKNDQERLGEALRHLNDTELQSLQALGAQAQRTGNEIAQVDKQMARVLNAKEPGAGGKGGKKDKPEEVIPKGSIKDLQQEMKKLQDAQALVTDAAGWQELQKQIGAVELKIERLKGKMLLTAGDVKLNQDVATDGLMGNPFEADNKAMEFTGSLKLQLDEKAMKAVDKQIKKQTKSMGEGWQDAAGAISAVGNAMAQIEDPAAKIVGTVGQAIASIALGFAQATAKDSKLGVFGWIAAVAGGLATMISTINTIHSATGYAEGGMIKGNSYSGDNLLAQGPDGGLIGLNAGEIVLNRAQTANLAQTLEGGSQGGGAGRSYVSGEQIFLGMNNYLRRSGRGELMTSR